MKIGKYEFDEYGHVVNTDVLKKDIITQAKCHDFYTFDLDNPKTIQEKINWLKIYDVNNTKGLAADKIKLHDYCMQKLGKDICVPILKIYDNPNDIDFSQLPDKFVLKCNHGYAMNIIVDKSNNKFTTLYKNPKSEDDCKKLVNDWLNKDFGLTSLQLHYSLINRKCYVEQFINDGHTTLTDYKIWCCNGEPEMIQVISNRYTNGLHANVYDTNWNWFDLGWHDFKQEKQNLDDKPACLDDMLKYAKIFANDFKFVRVDFYVINNEPYLGELTFTPDNGFGKFKNKDVDIYWGEKIKI